MGPSIYTSHLEDLPAEIILDILDLLKKPASKPSATKPNRGDVDFRSIFTVFKSKNGSDLKRLSLVNRFFRDLIIPVLFKHLIWNGVYNTFLEDLEFLEQSSGIWTHARYVFNSCIAILLILY